MSLAQLVEYAARISNSLRRDDRMCTACPPNRRAPATESHHIVPQHLGGAPDSPQTMLCGDCHSLIHQKATRVSKGEVLEFTTPQQSLLIKVIVSAMRTDKEGMDIDRHIMFKVPQSTLSKMHLRKRDLGFTNLIDYIKALIAADIGRL